MIEPALHTTSIFLSIVFIQSAIHKGLHFSDFSKVLRGYRLTPPGADKTLTAGLMTAEATAAGMLLVGPWLGSFGFFWAALLFTLYAAAIGVNLWRGLTNIDCGCHWSSAGDAGGQISVWHFARPLALAILSVGSGIGSAASSGQGGLTVFALGAAGAAPLVVAYGAMSALLENWSKMKALRV